MTKLATLYAAFRSLGETLVRKKMSYKNIKSLFDFIKKLSVELEEVNEFIKTNSKMINRKAELSDEDNKTFLKMLEKEVEFNEKLVLDFNDPLLEVSLFDLETLIHYDLISV